MRRSIAFILLVGIVLAVAGAACSNKSSGTKAGTFVPTNTPRPTSTPLLSSLERVSATADARATELARTPPPTATPIPPPLPHYDLKLVSFDCTIEYSYISVEGFVENVSGKTLEDVQAVGIFSDANGIPISSDTALIEYDPLLPGQSSPYEVLARYNPAMQGCMVEFKEFWGGTFRTDYSAMDWG